jgi:hypothetical protein
MLVVLQEHFDILVFQHELKAVAFVFEKLYLCMSKEVLLQLFIVLQLHIMNLSLQYDLARPQAFFQHTNTLSQLFPRPYNSFLVLLKLLHKQVTFPGRSLLRQLFVLEKIIL